MKDLGQLWYCLGIVCEVSEGQICINQRPYIDLVRRFGLSDACGVSTPADACVKLHMTAAKRVLRYLKQTRDLNLTYVKNIPEAIIGYSNAD